MKRILWSIGLISLISLFLVSTAFAQQSIRTEAASGLYLNKAAAGTDTLTSAKYVVGIVFNTIVASDTVELKNGTASVAKIIFTSSPPVYPIYIPYGIRVDSATVTIVRAKATNLTVIYRIGY